MRKRKCNCETCVMLRKTRDLFKDDAPEKQDHLEKVFDLIEVKNLELASLKEGIMADARRSRLQVQRVETNGEG